MSASEIPVSGSIENKGNISTETQINVLLAEYDKLQSQILTRLGANSTSLAAISVLLTVFVVAGVQFKYDPLFIIIPFLIGVYASLEIARQTFVIGIGRYIGTVERKINNLAGKELLTWDSRFTISRVSGRLIIGTTPSRIPIINPMAINSILVFLLILPAFIFSTIQGYIYLSSISLIGANTFAVFCGIVALLLIFGFVSAIYLFPNWYEQWILNNHNSES